MGMIFDAADGEGFHVVLAGDAAHLRPQACFKLRRNNFLAMLGAENVMHVNADVGVSHRAFS